MNLLHWLTSPEWAQLVKALLHSLWQGALIAGLLAVLLRRIGRPETRYRLLLAALGALFLASVVTWSLLSPRQPAVAAISQPILQPDITPPAPSGPVDKFVVAANWTTAKPQVHWTAWLALAWLLGTAAMLGRASVKVAGAEQLRRACQPLNDPRITELLAEARRAVKLTRRVRVAVTNQLTSPAVVGVLVPTLILPLSLITTLSPEQLRFVLLHELAHIRRGDYLANLFQLFAEALFFFNPAVWWLSHQIRREREACCDALAIELSGAPADYARTLVSVAETMLNPAPAAAPAFGNDREPSSLADRVQRALVPDYRPSLHLTWRAMLAALVAGGVLLGLLAAGARETVAAAGSMLPAAPVKQPASPAPDSPVKLKQQEGVRVPLANVVDVHADGSYWILANVVNVHADGSYWMGSEHLQLSEIKKRLQDLQPGVHIFIDDDPEAPDDALVQLEQLRRKMNMARDVETGSTPGKSTNDFITWAFTVDSAKFLKVARQRLSKPDGYPAGQLLTRLWAALGVRPHNWTFKADEGRLVVRATTEDVKTIARLVQSSAPASRPTAPTNSAVTPTEGIDPATGLPERGAAKASHASMDRDVKAMQAASLVRNGKLLFESGKKDDAKTLFLSALELDADNGAAKYYLELIEGQVGGTNQAALYTRTFKIASNDFPRLSKFFGPRAWSSEPPPPRFFSYSIEKGTIFVTGTRQDLDEIGSVLEPIGALKPAPADPRREILEKLGRIRLDTAAFDNVPLSEVVRLVSKECRQRDPDKRGINFFIVPHADQIVSGPFGPVTNTSVPVDMSSVVVKIYAPLASIKLADLLEVIVKSADKPIQYSVHDYGIVFSSRETNNQALGFDWYLGNFLMGGKDVGALTGTPPSYVGSPSSANPGGVLLPLYSRTFKLGSNELARAMGNPELSSATNKQQKVREFFTRNGAEIMSPGKAVFYNDRQQTLFVRATLADLDKIETLLQTPEEPLRVEGTNASVANPAKLPVLDAPFPGLEFFQQGIRQGEYPRPTNNTPPLYTRTFTIPSNELARVFGDLGPWWSTNRFQTFREFFDRIGVDMKAPGKSIFYSEGKGGLFVRATLQDLDKIEALLPSSEVSGTNLYTRTFQIGVDDLARAVGNHESTNTCEMFRELVSRLHVDMGAPGKFIYCRNGQGRQRIFLVRATHLDLYKIEYMVNSWRGASSRPPATTNSPAGGTNLLTRSFKVDPNTFMRGPDDPEDFVFPPTTNVTGRARNLFTRFGVDLLAPGKSVFYNDRTGVLLVRATPADMDLIEQVIQVQSIVPPQVNIRAKFVEVPSDGSANVVLGVIDSKPHLPGSVKWVVGSSNVVSSSGTNRVLLTGVLTDPQYRVVLKALEQREGVEIVAAPDVTTVSGRQAQMQVDIQPQVRGAAVINPPPQFPTGPVLDIVPYVSADGYSVQMVVIPTVTEFVGYEKPGTFVPKSGTNNLPASGAPIPHYRVRQLTSQATVWDGQTMVIGGFVTEDKAAVPNSTSVPGDMSFITGEFLNAPKVPEKKQLLVFITPTVIDPAGNRVHTDFVPPFRRPPEPGKIYDRYDGPKPLPGEKAFQR